MKRLVLQRTRPKDNGAVLGILTTEDGDTFTTLEPASKRIPPGDYLMQRDHTGKHQWWKIVGFDLAAQRAVEMHIGNEVKDSDACILLGKGVARMPSGPSVTNSADALAELLDAIGDGDHWLRIEEPFV